MQLLCKSFACTNSLTPIIGNEFYIFRACLIFIGYFCFCFSTLYVLFFLLSQRKNYVASSVGDTNKKHIVKYAMIIFICWIPYFIIFYPGVSNWDVGSEIMQYFHIKNDFILSLSNITNKDVYATNMHPYFDTLVFGGFIKLGIVMVNSAQFGAALYSLFQMGAFSILFSCIWNWFYNRLEVKGQKYIKYFLLYSALCPLYAMFSVSMLKDTLFSFFSLLITYEMIKISYSKGTILESKKFVIGLVIVSILFELTKNQGVYILMVAGIVSLFSMRHYWRQILVIFFVPVFLYFFVWSNLLLPAWNVAPGGKQEAIGFMFQQTARYVRDYKDEITEEEKEVISNILPYDELGDLYNPIQFDSVKYKYYQDSSNEELFAYYKIWISMFFKHPSCYIDALLNSSYAYFGISENSGWFYGEFANAVDDTSELYITNPFSSKHVGFVSDTIKVVQKIPFISVIFNLAVYTWIIIFIFAYLIYAKAYNYLQVLWIPLAQVCIYFLSPDNSNIRYVMPNMYMILPLIAMAMLLIQSSNQHSENQAIN